jgi:5-dehydro-2-deoxygluconokinase
LWDRVKNIKNNHFLVLGRAGLDLYADPPGTRTEEALAFSSALGGSAANIAVAISKLGGRASLISCVSDDAVGRYILNQLKAYGVACDHMHVVTGEARSSLAVVETRAENCQSVIYRNGASDFQLDEAHVQNIPYTDYGALIVTGTSLAVEPSRCATLLAMKLAGEAGLPVIIDIDYRPYSWASADEASQVYSSAAAMCDIIIGNDVEFGVMGEGLALARKLAQSADVVIYKMGEKGSITFSGAEEFETGIYPVAALKPTGAGDAFMGAFIANYAEGIDIETCVKRGSAAAAIVVTRVGCAPAMPNAEELDQFMKDHG